MVVEGGDREETHDSALSMVPARIGATLTHGPVRGIILVGRQMVQQAVREGEYRRLYATTGTTSLMKLEHISFDYNYIAPVLSPAYS